MNETKTEVAVKLKKSENDEFLLRADFIDRFAQKGYTKKDSAIIIDDFVDTIIEIIAEGKTLRIHGFGEFYSKQLPDRKMHTMVNNREAIDCKGHCRPYFKPGQRFCKSVDAGFLTGRRTMPIVDADDE